MSNLYAIETKIKLKTRSILIYLFCLCFDLLAIFIALILSALYSISPHVIPSTKYTLTNLNLPYIFFLAAFVWYFSSKSTGLYNEPSIQPLSEEILKIINNVIFQLIFIILFLFSVKEHTLTRTFVLAYSILLSIILLIEKTIIRSVLSWTRNKLRNLNNVLIIGANEVGMHIRKRMVDSSLGYHIVGFIDDEIGYSTELPVLGTIQELEKILNDKTIDLVIVALLKPETEYIENIVRICQDKLVDIKIIPELMSYYIRGYSYSFLADIPVVSINIERLSEPYWQFVKRFFDISLTLILTMAIFSWLFPLIILLQKIFDSGPIFYRTERWGKSGRPFIIYKFNTMAYNEDLKENKSKHVSKTRYDQYVTKFGKVLRQTSFDELPQFYNVLKGDMSIVGPRPLDSNEAAQMKSLLNNYMMRHYIRPGITGWAQINGYRGTTENISLMQKRINLDNWYIKNWTLGLDIQIVLISSLKIFTGDSNAK